jgi:hypothetical protein
MYETRTLLEAITRMMPAHQFIKDIIFSTTKIVLTKHVDVDFQKENRRVAPFIAKGAGGFTMDRQGYVTRTYQPPFVAPQRKMTIEDIESRSMGENVYSQRTPEDREAERIADDLAFLEKTIARREEKMCADILLTGKTVMRGYIDSNLTNYTTDTLDYGFEQTVVLSGSALWANQDTSKPFDDLKSWRKTILINSGSAPNMVIMASNLVDDFVTHPQIVGILNRNVMLGILSPVADGFEKYGLSKPSVDLGKYEGYLTFVGTLPGLGLEIYQYDNYYDDDTNDYALTQLIPDNTVIVHKRDMGRVFYGAVTQMETDGLFHTYALARVPKIWSSLESDTRMIRTTSRPVPAPDVIEDWLVATVG